MSDEFQAHIAKNEVKAVKWHRKAADQGDAAAQFNLGLMIASGRGTSKSDVEAMKAFRKAAEQGYADAQSNLSCVLVDGRGTSKNEVEAVKWYRKAAEQDKDMQMRSLTWA